MNIEGLYEVTSVIALFLVLTNIQVALSADRYWAVCHPMTYFIYNDSGYKKYVAFGCILFGLSLSSFHLFGWNDCRHTVYEGDSVFYCGLSEMKPGFKICFFCWILILTVFLVILNGCIIYTLIGNVRFKTNRKVLEKF